MIVFGHNLKMTRGDSETIRVAVNGYTMQTGDKLEMTVRRRIGSPPVLHKVVTDFPENSAIITIFPEDTSELSFGKYVYDLQLTYDGEVKTIVTPSAFEIGEEVTHD